MGAWGAQQSPLEGLGYICVSAQWCPFTTHWALQLYYTCLLGSRRKSPVRGGCIQAAEDELSEAVCQVTDTPVSSLFLKDVSET